MGITGGESEAGDSRKRMGKRGKPAASAAARPAFSDWVLCAACFVYLTVLPAIMALAMPEKVVATGVHQTYGACAQAVVDLFGYTRAKFLCRESYDEDFHFDCSDQRLPPDRPSWYTLCGRAHSNFPLYMGVCSVLAATTSICLGGMLLPKGLPSGSRPKAKNA